MSAAVCRKCAVPLVVGETWTEGKARRDNRFCRSCQSAYNHEWRNRPSTRGAERRKWDAWYDAKRCCYLIARARRRATRKGLPFDLDQHRPELQRRLAIGMCELSGLPFRFGGGWTYDSPSFDRIDSTGGYTYANVRIVLWGLNAGCGSWGLDTLLMMTDAVRAQRAAVAHLN